MDAQQQEEWLDRELAKAAVYIDDDGFTRRVLQGLPAPRPRRSSARALILIGLTLLGSVIAYFLSDGGRFITETLMRLSTLPLWWLLGAAGAAGIVVAAGGCFAALFETRALPYK